MKTAMVAITLAYVRRPRRRVNMGSLRFGVMESTPARIASRAAISGAGYRLAGSWAGSLGAAHSDLAAARPARGERVARLCRHASPQPVGRVAADEPEPVAQRPTSLAVGAQRAERGPLAGRLLDLKLDQLPPYWQRQAGDPPAEDHAAAIEDPLTRRLEAAG